MDSWDILSCVLLQLLPAHTAQITPVLVISSLLFPQDSRADYRAQIFLKSSYTGGGSASLSLVFVKSLGSTSQETQGQLWLDKQRVENTLGWLQAECCCKAQESMSEARAVQGIHPHRHRKQISRGTACGGGPAGKGTSETQQPEAGSDRREEEDRELMCSVFY